MASIKPLLLAGGQSTRMGRRKELLCLPDGTPMFIHLASLLRETHPESERVSLSLRDRSALSDLLLPNQAHQEAEDLIRIESRNGSLLSGGLLHDMRDPYRRLGWSKYALFFRSLSQAPDIRGSIPIDIELLCWIKVTSSSTAAEKTTSKLVTNFTILTMPNDYGTGRHSESVENLTLM